MNIWPRSYWVPTESSWITEQKFGYLNEAEGRPLRQQFKAWQDARATERIRRERDRLLPYRTTEFRFCPVCISQWSHPAIFQVETLRKCPIHEVPILDRCSDCGWRIDIQPTSNDCSRGPVLHCWRCKRPLAGRSVEFGQLFAVKRADPRVVSMERRLLDEHGRPDRVRVLGNWYDIYLSPKVCMSVAARSPDIEWFDVLTPIRFHVLDAKHESVDVTEALSVLKAVDKNMRRRVLARCGHREPRKVRLRSGRTYVYVNGPANQCPVCFSLIVWRVQFGEIFESALLAPAAGPKVELPWLGFAAVASFPLVAYELARELRYRRVMFPELRCEPPFGVRTNRSCIRELHRSSVCGSVLCSLPMDQALNELGKTTVLPPMEEGFWLEGSKWGARAPADIAHSWQRLFEYVSVGFRSAAESAQGVS